MTRLFGVAAAFVASAALTAGVAGFQPPDGGPKKGPPGKGEKKGKGDRRGPKGFELGKVLPPHVADELGLTPDQEKKLAALEKEVKAKLEKILTPEQVKKLDDVGPPPMGGPGGPPPPPREKGERPDPDKKR